MSIYSIDWLHHLQWNRDCHREWIGMTVIIDIVEVEVVVVVEEDIEDQGRLVDHEDLVVVHDVLGVDHDDVSVVLDHDLDQDLHVNLIEDVRFYFN